MAIIINIEVSGKTGFVSLAKNGMVIETISNENQQDHASFLQPAIKALLINHHISKKAVEAIALSNGPGSYTGLRVGLASAKGLSFALNIPLVIVNTLQVMALAAKIQWHKENSINNVNRFHGVTDELDPQKNIDNDRTSGEGIEILFCPLLDARRMEVFFGLYNYDNEVIIPPAAAVLDVGFMQPWLERSMVVLTGPGAEKLKKIITHPNALFEPQDLWDKAFALLSYQFFCNNIFADLNLTEPFYCKEFYDTTVHG